MQLTIFVLNAYRHKTLRGRKLLEFSRYIRELGNFIEFYLLARYGIDVITNFVYPKLYFKTYADVQAYDALDTKNTGKGLQMYLGYGMRARPHEDKGNFIGYCECKVKSQITPLDMMYADMPAYDMRGPLGALIKSIYHFYEETGRLVMHELDHQALRLLGDSGYVSKVHKAETLPRKYWAKQTGYGTYREFREDEIGIWLDTIYFKTQVDPRNV